MAISPLIRRMPFHLAFAVLLAASLAGCGSGPDPEPPHLAADVAWPVDPAEARRLTGATEPTFTEADIYAAQKKIVGAADSLLMTDFNTLNENTGQIVAYFPQMCDMASCTGSAGEQTLTTRIIDLALARPDYKTKYRSEPIGELHGFWFDQTVGKDRGALSGLDVDVKAGRGWLDHSGFAVFGLRNAEQGLWTPGALSLGQATGGPPGGLGTATFMGGMVAMDTSPTQLAGSVIAGTAAITVELDDSPTVDVAFTGMHNLNAGIPRDDLTWTGLGLRDGRFGDDTMDGRFYGPQGEEVGGVFQRDQMIGGFGARKQ